MAFSEPEKSKIRQVLGYPNLFKGFNTHLENAMLAVQSTGDGGIMPDNTTELRIRANLAVLDSIETKITALWCGPDVIEAGKTKLDAVRAGFYLENQGRKVINKISIDLEIKPYRDYFSVSELDSGLADFNKY